MGLSCPLCGKNITIPPKPVWLPIINEALRRIVKDDLSGTTRNTRVLLREAIVAAGYDPAKACAEPDSPDDLLTFDRLNLVRNTNRDIAYGYREFVQSQAVVDEWPALELFRAGEREQQRDWEQRWREAARTARDTDAARVLEKTDRMVALKDSAIWHHLGSDWDDSIGNPFPPFAIDSGMRVEEVGTEEAIALGLMDDGDTQVKAREIVPPRLIPIEDERITEYLWNKLQVCDHCGKDKATRLLHSCDDCGGSICRECIAEARKCPEPEPPRLR